MGKPHHEASLRLEQWIRKIQNDGDENKKLVIIEIGAGFNTPTVTRMPMEFITRQVPNARFVRINPMDYEIPRDLGDRAIGVSRGLDVLYDIQKTLNTDISRSNGEDLDGYLKARQNVDSKTSNEDMIVTGKRQKKKYYDNSPIPTYRDGSSVPWDYFYRSLRH